MTEKEIEKYLVGCIKEIGGRAYKWVSPGNDGVPDRIVVMPEGKVVFVELKKPGGKPTLLQSSQHRRLRELGCDVRVIDSYIGVEALQEELQHGI